MGSETRARNLQIKVRVNQEEMDEITRTAEQCDLKPSTLLRELGLGHEPKSKVDIQAFEKLAQIHGDIGRVGGLLKMWLADSSRSAYGNHLGVKSLVNGIDELQQETREVARSLSF